MSGHGPARPDVREAGVTMPAAFWAFHERYYPVYLSYAELQLGERRRAVDLVDRVFVHLARHWPMLMREESPEATAWAMMKSAVEERLIFEGRRHTMPATAAFQQVSRRVLDDFRAELSVLESALGLYAAIAELPERQFDVVVLQYVLGYPAARTAEIMGIAEVTVRTYRHLARRTLARKLSLDGGGRGADADR
ncbi:sigma-70 family RNA polymerase sigma factor [Streptomyces avicenniae]|uniref:sigma-70 family RNA polymerase sigma factor n=1 Tax=Streptomyces avicenniae TaxID=500153 RepID=UPI001CBA63B3|nr:sigma-70 family RNA polymerase sigma factor [Streptomyces avicenniae]